MKTQSQLMVRIMTILSILTGISVQAKDSGVIEKSACRGEITSNLRQDLQKCTDEELAANRARIEVLKTEIEKTRKAIDEGIQEATAKNDTHITIQIPNGIATVAAASGLMYLVTPQWKGGRVVEPKHPKLHGAATLIALGVTVYSLAKTTGQILFYHDFNPSEKQDENPMFEFLGLLEAELAKRTAVFDLASESKPQN